MRSRSKPTQSQLHLTGDQTHLTVVSPSVVAHRQTTVAETELRSSRRQLHRGNRCRLSAIHPRARSPLAVIRDPKGCNREISRWRHRKLNQLSCSNPLKLLPLNRKLNPQPQPEAPNQTQLRSPTSPLRLKPFRMKLTTTSI